MNKMLTINKEKGKIMKKILGLILISIFMSISAKAEWQSMVPSGHVSSTLVKNNTIFATCLGQGVFRSENEGVSWTQLNNGLSSTIVTSSCSNDDYIYIGTFDGVYRSDNKGDNWQKCNNGINDTLHIQAIYAIDSILFALTETNGVYTSRNNGNLWKLKPDSIIPEHCRNKFTFNQINYTITYQSDYYKIIANFGNKYYNINRGLDSTKSFSSLTTHGDSLYLLTYDGSIHSLSIPDTASIDSIYQNYEWKFVNDFNHSTTTCFDYNGLKFINDTYFATAFIGLYKGKLGVLESEIINNGITFPTLNELISVQNKLFCTDRCGSLYKSDNNAISWQKINISNDTNLFCISCCTDETNLYVRIKVDNKYYLMKSHDAGINWVKLGPDFNSSFGIYPCLDEIIFITEDGIFRMDLDGNNYKKLNIGFDYKGIGGIYKTNNIILLSSTNNNIYKGINNGTEWKCVANNSIGNTRYISKFGLIGNTLFAVSYDEIYKSVDWGDTWTQLNIQIPAFTISQMETINNTLYIAYNSGICPDWYSDDMSSTDYGVTWTYDIIGLGVEGFQGICEQNGLIFSAIFESSIAFKQKPGSSTPKLMYPANNSDKIDLNDRLIWCKMDGVKKYEVNISKNSDFSNGKLQTIDNVTIETEMYYVDKLQLDKNAKYYWRVKGIGDGMNTDWSETSSFTTGETSDIFDNFKEYLISIAPQPANDEAFITFHNSNNINELNVEIYDIKGTLLDNVHFNSLLNGMNNLRLDISKLSTGFYNVIIKSNSETYHTKLIKK